MKRVRVGFTLQALVAGCLAWVGVAAETPKPEAKKEAVPAKTAAQSTLAKGSEQPKVWFRPEYLLLWSSDMNTPKYLVSSGSNADSIPGALGQPGTRDLTKDDPFDGGMQHGARFTVGAWLNDGNDWGVEASGFFDPARQSQTWSSGGDPALGLPFYNTLLGQEDSYIVAWTGLPLPPPPPPRTQPTAIYPFTGPMSGTFKVTTKSGSWGADIAALRNFHRGERINLDWKAGFQYFNLSEEYQHTATSAATGPGDYYFLSQVGVPAALGDTISMSDRIETSNNFYGAFFGLRCHFQYCDRLEVDVLPKLGLGAMVQEVDRSGRTVLRTGTLSAVAPGGFYCLPTNLGKHSKTKFAAIPALELKVGCRIIKELSAHVGYSIHYVSSVARPTDQLDRRINEAYVPASSLYGAGGAAVPRAVHKTDDFFAHGLNAGFTIRF